MHLKSVGHPIANDVKYGGILFNDIPFFDEKNETSNEEEKSSESKDDVFNPSLIQGHSLKFWLHAFKYTFKEKEYQTKFPDWATKDYNVDIVFELPHEE